MRCQYFLEKKNRYCCKKSLNDGKYCSIHQKLSKIQNGGNINNNEFISPYALVSSQLAPDPAQQSWYHYQAPIYQSFGDYLCIKKSFINNARDLINDVFTEQKTS